MNPKYIARCAQIAMLLEVSATPKPGNVDRDHDFADLRYEHFLASAIGVGHVFERAAVNDNKVGSLIREAVEESAKWNGGRNTHFGTFLLLVPLIVAAGKGDVRAVNDVVRNTTVEDAIELYKAFKCVDVYLEDIDDLNVKDATSVDEIRRRGLTLYDIIQISAEHDGIAQEWVRDFSRTLAGARMLAEKAKEMSMNDAIVHSYLALLAERPDTLVQKKFGSSVAEEVGRKASAVLKERNIDAIRRFDDELIRRKINPGTTADIVAASLFVHLLEEYDEIA
ncbi:MAG: triphosphoribosyl-dephospho-CoA synthase [Methanosarcinales archaeon Met12]|nr:MAG: triphosphoribosyl-dephospho-CoA synthase [Methanosarcinales archaeon Met12]